MHDEVWYGMASQQKKWIGRRRGRDRGGGERQRDREMDGWIERERGGAKSNQQKERTVLHHMWADAG